ncbi:MAG: putative peptidoglycan binding domain protein [Chlorobi bacterium OLB7]|nr:MAG: putative peptidoglycan binding domain protein [Chlorobi bacterium OLB7]
MNYPKRVIKKGEKDGKIVRAIQKELNARGCGPLEVDGDFGPKTLAAVKLFQTRFTDQNGNPLVADGEVGAVTWAALFGQEKVPVVETNKSPLATAAIAAAKSQLGVLENPLGSNKGPEVNAYLASVGLGPGYFWCMAFVYWCYQQAAEQLKKNNPLVKTAGVMAHWNAARAAGTRCITTKEAADNPGLVKPGMIFIISTAEGLGTQGWWKACTEGCW